MTGPVESRDRAQTVVQLASPARPSAGICAAAGVTERIDKRVIFHSPLLLSGAVVPLDPLDPFDPDRAISSSSLFPRRRGLLVPCK